MEKSLGSAVVNERSWPEVFDDYSHLPTHYRPSDVPPEAVKYQSPHQTFQQPPVQTSNSYNGAIEQREKRYCGLTIFQLIVLILLAISVVLGAILGGIFGSGILSKRGRSRNSDTDGGSVDGTDTASLSSFSFTDPSVPTRTVTQNPTSTGNGLNSATGTGLSADYCNNATTYTDTTSTNYLIICQIDWPDNSIRPGSWVHDLKFLENQPTLAGCLDACSTWVSGGQSSQVCRAVVWNYKEQCYLKNQTGAREDTFFDYDPKYIQAGIRL